MKRLWGFSIWFAALAACSGGSGDGAGGAAGPVTAEQACADYADAICDLEQACEPGTLDFFWGAVATCKERVKVDCPYRFAVSGTKETPARLEACANALASSSCAAYFDTDHQPGACIHLVGDLPDGASCGLRSQCQGGTCRKVATHSDCGVCVSATAGSSCEFDSQCPANLVCSNGTCAPPSKHALGDACDIDHRCAGGLACAGSNGTGTGTCSKPFGPGSSCDPMNETGDECDPTQALACDLAQRACNPRIPLRAAGQPCDVGQSCDGSSWCDSGTCRPKSREGEPCVDDVNPTVPSCLAPARCVDGVCAIPDPRSCR
jgi:hypothetical protein